MDNKQIIEGVLLTPEKIISHNKGDIYHILKNDEIGFFGFGEVYFSKINYNKIKAWKKHFKMVCNFIVPNGKVKIVIYDDRINSITRDLVNEFVLSNEKENYYRLTIPNGLWYGFKGLSKDENILLNFSNIIHNPNEQVSNNIESINYKW